MLSEDGKKVLCDVQGCGREAVGGCELRIAAPHGGNKITIPGDLMAWCEFDEDSMSGSIRDEFVILNLAQLKAGYISRAKSRRKP